MQAVRDRIAVISEETNTFRCVFWFMPDHSLRLLTHIKPSVIETPFLRAAKLYIYQKSLLEPDEWIDLPSLREYYITWERLFCDFSTPQRTFSTPATTSSVTMEFVTWIGVA